MGQLLFLFILIGCLGEMVPLATSITGKNDSLLFPGGVAVDTHLNVYISDWGGSIRSISVTGNITAIVPTQARSTSISISPSGVIFIADFFNHKILSVNSTTGVISAIAGNGNPGDNIMASNTSFNFPTGVAVDILGNILIADRNNHRIRRISSSTNMISSIAGNGIPAFSGENSVATNASLNYPSSIVVDSLGNIFIADRNNHRI
jgi:hypothetical protein